MRLVLKLHLGGNSESGVIRCGTLPVWKVIMCTIVRAPVTAARSIKRSKVRILVGNSTAEWVTSHRPSETSEVDVFVMISSRLRERP